MSSRTLNVVGALCIIAIVLSGLNSYLILTNLRPQQAQPDELRDAIDETREQIVAVESTLSDLNNQVNALNRTVFASMTDLETTFQRLNSTVDDLASAVSELADRVDRIPQQTPANVYESAYKSVVVIRTPIGQGSGFLYLGQDLILTNWHVITGATDIEVEFYDRTRSKATVVGEDAYADVAVLTVLNAPLDAKPLKLADSSKIWIGQQVIAIGNPLGLAGSLSSGYISQVNRLLDLPPIIVPVLQLDITIAPGSSGGPLLDLSGSVVGITNAGTQVGFNFAVPSNIVNRVALSLVEKGEYLHPFVGFSAVVLSPETIRSLNILNIEPYQTGLMIMNVISDTPAARAGLRAAVSTTAPDGSAAYDAMDIILAVDNHPTLTMEDWAAYIEEHVSPDQAIILSLWRSGEKDSIVIVTTSRPAYQG